LKLLRGILLLVFSSVCHILQPKAWAKAICFQFTSDMGVGGIYSPPQGAPYLRPKLVGEVWQFFPRSKKVFGETSDLLFFLLAAGETFGSWGVYSPPNGKNVPMSGLPLRLLLHVVFSFVQTAEKVAHKKQSRFPLPISVYHCI
jgi:hypothetical protein